MDASWYSIILICVLLIPSQAVIVSTKLGNIRGTVKQNKAINIYEFIGIPYAQPPLEDLRFAPSQLNSQFNATYNATQFGPACLQPHGFLQEEAIISEDCLYLNIWSTSLDKDANIPVMFWIHGGGFQYGSGGDTIFHGNNCGNELNRDCIPIGEKVVFVSINYRLGVFGFLSNADLYKSYGTYGGLNGIGDQITALNWVYKHISDFGGNPNNITIFGESAGGISTCILSISPVVKKQHFTIQGSIIESGACNGPWAPSTRQSGVNSCNNKLTSNGYSTNIDTLRKQITNATEFVLTIGGVLSAVDDLILTDMPVNIYNSKNLKDVFNPSNIIIGFNSMDGLGGWPWLEPWDVARSPETNEEYKRFLQLYIHNETQVDLMYNYYYPPSNFPPYMFHVNASIAWYSVVGDACLSCASFQLARNILDNANVNPYVYLFSGTQYPYYAGHGSELPFVFDYDDITTNAVFEIPWNQSVSNCMVSAWTNFGLYAIPNVTNDINKVNIKWDTYGKQQNVMILTTQMGMKTNVPPNYRNNVCDFWANELGPTIQELICFDLL
eukprot:408678_1